MCHLGQQERRRDEARKRVQAICHARQDDGSSVFNYLWEGMRKEVASQIRFFVGNMIRLQGNGFLVSFGPGKYRNVKIISLMTHVVFFLLEKRWKLRAWLFPPKFRPLKPLSPRNWERFQMLQTRFQEENNSLSCQALHIQMPCRTERKGWRGIHPEMTISSAKIFPRCLLTFCWSIVASLALIFLR